MKRNRERFGIDFKGWKGGPSILDIFSPIIERKYHEIQIRGIVDRNTTIFNYSDFRPQMAIGGPNLHGWRNSINGIGWAQIRSPGQNRQKNKGPSKREVFWTMASFIHSRPVRAFCGGNLLEIRRTINSYPSALGSMGEFDSPPRYYSDTWYLTNTDAEETGTERLVGQRGILIAIPSPLDGVTRKGNGEALRRADEVSVFSPPGCIRLISFSPEGFAKRMMRGFSPRRPDYS